MFSFAARCSLRTIPAVFTLKKINMKITTTLLTGIILLPAFALAMDPFDRYVEENDIEISNESSIYNETSASASSGGQTAAAGQTMTDGDVSASSHVETRINAGSEGGEVYVKTETTENGETTTEEYTENLEAGKPVKVNVSAKATTEGSEVETKVNGETVEGDETSATAATVEFEFDSGIEKALRAVPNFFKKVFGFFWGW